MSTLKEALIKFDDTNRTFYEKKRDIDLKIERLTKRLKKLIAVNNTVRWTTALLVPIGQELVSRLGAHSFEIMGPFGLSCETSIHVWMEKRAEMPKDVDWEKCGSLTFHPYTVYHTLLRGDHSSLTVVDYHTNTNEYSKGSIGAMNGMNHPEVIVDDWSMEQFYEYFLKVNPKFQAFIKS